MRENTTNKFFDEDITISLRTGNAGHPEPTGDIVGLPLQIDLTPGDNGIGDQVDRFFLESPVIHITGTPTTDIMCLKFNGIGMSPSVLSSLDTGINPDILLSINGGINFNNIGQAVPQACIDVKDGDQFKFIGHTSDYTNGIFNHNFRLEHAATGTAFDTNTPIGYRTGAGGLTLPAGSFD